jgi:hypothetical protein
MAQSYVTSCKHLNFRRSTQMCFDKTYYYTEVILHIYIKQHRSFELSNIRRIIRISTTDYTKSIATVKGTSSYIASRRPRYVEFCPLLNNKSTPLPSEQKRQ